jgi:hypothetical protein
MLMKTARGNKSARERVSYSTMHFKRNGELTMTHLGRITRTSVVATMVSAMALAGFSAPAGATVKTSTELFARHICQSVIRVRPGVGEFDGCVSSLVDSLQSINHGQAVAQARDACFAQGLKSGSTDLNLCLLYATEAKASLGAAKLPDTASALTGIADDPQSSESYFAVTSGTQFHREQQACALLGLDPAFGAFANCVTDLQSTLQAIGEPAA